MEGYISLFESLRYAYAQSGMFDKALQLSKDIVVTCKQSIPGKTSYEQMQLAFLLQQSDSIGEENKAAIKSLEYYEQYGNSESGFYVTTPLSFVLLNLVSDKKYNDAIAFMDAHRDKTNQFLIGKDTLELYQLSIVNSCMYRSYMETGRYNKAVNTAFLVSNYVKYSHGFESIDHAIWLGNAAEAYLSLYQVDNNSDHLSKVDTLFTMTDDIWNKVKNKDNDTNYATYLGTKGRYYYIKKDYSKAGIFYKESLSLHSKLNANEDIILSDKLSLARLYSKTGKANDAISLYKSILSRYEQIGDSANVGEVNRRLSSLYSDKGDLKLAERYAVEAYDILSSCSSHSLAFANAEDNLASLYSRMGLNEKAVNLKLNCVQILQSLGMASSSDILETYELYADTYSSVITYYPDTIRWFTDMASSYCEKLLRKTGIEQSDKIAALKLHAKINMLLGNYKAAEKGYEECANLLKLLLGIKDDRYLTVMNNLAYSYLLDGNYDKSREISVLLLKQDKSETNYQNLENLLGIGIMTGDAKLSEEALKKVYEREINYLSTRFLFMNSTQRQDFIDGDNIGISNLSLPALAFPDNNVCAQYAYNSALVSKGLLLNTTHDIEQIAASSTDLVIKSLYDKLLRTRKEMEVTTDSASLSKLKEIQDNTEKELVASIAETKDFTKNLRKDWKDVRHALKNSDFAVELLLADSSVLNQEEGKEFYCATILRKGWNSPKFIKLSAKEDIDKYARRIIEAFNNGNGLRGSQWKYISNQLYKRIWEPLKPFINKGDTVFFSPVDILCITPLEALCNSQGKIIGEEYALHRLSSTKELCDRVNTTKNKNVVLYGGLTYTDPKDSKSIINTGRERDGWQYLPATATEVESIDSILSGYGAQIRKYEKLEGSELSFRNLSGDSIEVLHIATHGFCFNDKQSNTLQFLRSIDVSPNQDMHVSPLKRTGIMLSGGQAAWLGMKKTKDNDGILLSSEITSLDLHKTDLIVLSACQTGLGDISEDGVVGLQRAFKMAGVRTLVMTLWKVDDKATSYMMINFYSQLIQGRSKIVAFNNAKQMVKEKFVDPFYWAPFIMID